jgi:hypothetical protein
VPVPAAVERLADPVPFHRRSSARALLGTSLYPRGDESRDGGHRTREHR